MELINHENFNLDTMTNYLNSNEGDIFDDNGKIIPKNKCKNRFFQLFIEYIDMNNDIINPTNEQLINLRKIFAKLKNYDTYKYFELYLISSYGNYLSVNFSKDEMEKVIEEWIKYCLKMHEFHRVFRIIKNNKKNFDYNFTVSILKLLSDYVKKNCRFIINAFKNNNFDKDFKLLYLLCSLLSFGDKISIEEYKKYRDGILAYFNGVYEVFFSFFLNKEWHGIYNDNEYRNKQKKNQIKKETVKHSKNEDHDLDSESNEIDDFNKLVQQSSDEEEIEDHTQFMKNGDSFLINQLDVSDCDEIKKKCFAFNTEGVVRFFIYLSGPLELKINQNTYFEYVSLLISLSNNFSPVQPERNDTYYKTYNYYLNQNINESLLLLATITPYVQTKLFNQLLPIIYKEKDLFYNYNNYFDLQRDFGPTIDVLLKNNEFDYQVFSEFVKFFIDRLKGRFNNNENQYFRNKVVQFVRLLKNIDLEIAIPLINQNCQKLNLKPLDLFAFTSYYFKLKMISFTLKDKILISSIFKVEEYFLPLIKSKEKMKIYLSLYKIAFQCLKEQRFVQHPIFCHNFYRYGNMDNFPIKKQFIISILDHLVTLTDFNFIKRFMYPYFKQYLEHSFYYNKKLKWNFDHEQNGNNVHIKDEDIKTIILMLCRDPSTIQIRKLNLSLVCKRFREIIVEEMNSTLKYPIDIGINIYNIKIDKLNYYSLLMPSKVRYLKYAVSNFFDPNLSVLRIFKNIEKLEVDGLTELDEGTLQILDSIKTLKIIQINELPFGKIDDFFVGFNQFQGYIKDQYLDNKQNLEFYGIDNTSFPKELNIKINTFEEYKKSIYGKEFHLSIQDYQGEFDCKLNQIMKFHIHIIKYKRIETSIRDFLKYYFTSYHLSKIPSFSLFLNSIVDKNTIDLFKFNRDNKKLENLLEVEFIINKICHISQIQTILSILELAINLEKISIKFQYDKNGDSLIEDNKEIVNNENLDIDSIIENNIEMFFKIVNDKFKNVNKIEISDFYKRSIFINWKKIKLYKFRSSYPYKYVYFIKK